MECLDECTSGGDEAPPEVQRNDLYMRLADRNDDIAFGAAASQVQGTVVISHPGADVGGHRGRFGGQGLTQRIDDRAATILLLDQQGVADGCVHTSSAHYHAGGTALLIGLPEATADLLGWSCSLQLEGGHGDRPTLLRRG